jgi:hypothetical protein
MLREAGMTDDCNAGMVPVDVQASLMDEWKRAVEFKELSPGSVERALLFGRNIRVNLPAALVAGYQTVMAGFSVAKAINSGDDWARAIWDAYRAAQSVFSALIEKIGALEYVTAVILSKSPQGMDEGELLEEVNKFLDDPKTKEFGWHLGMTGQIVEDARNARYEGWLVQIVAKLDSQGFLSRSGTKLQFQQKHVEWKFGI